MMRAAFWALGARSVPGSYVIIDVKTLDALGPDFVASHHTDRARLAAHVQRERETIAQYGGAGALPPRMRLVPFVVSTMGALGSSAEAFITELSRRQRTIPFSLADETTWAAPQMAPFARMAVCTSVRRSVAVYHRRHWARHAQWPLPVRRRGPGAPEVGG